MRLFSGINLVALTEFNTVQYPTRHQQYRPISKTTSPLKSSQVYLFSSTIPIYFSPVKTQIHSAILPYPFSSLLLSSQALLQLPSHCRSKQISPFLSFIYYTTIFFLSYPFLSFEHSINRTRLPILYLLRFTLSISQPCLLPLTLLLTPLQTTNKKLIIKP